MNDKIIKESLSTAKTIAMIGVSSVKKDDPSNIKRRPSIIVMQYLQEFGYRVIPVNPFAEGEIIHGEKVFSKLEDIEIPIDIVNIFRPSIETPDLANEAVKINAKVLWLQYGIKNDAAEKIALDAKMKYISNRCIKQDYQNIFQKVNPVFPALKN